MGEILVEVFGSNTLEFGMDQRPDGNCRPVSTKDRTNWGSAEADVRAMRVCPQREPFEIAGIIVAS